MTTSPAVPDFHSERLVYRAASSSNADDVQCVYEIMRDPYVQMRESAVPSKPLRKEDVQDRLKAHDKGRLANWIICLPKDPQADLANVKDDELIRIGWILVAEFGGAAQRKCQFGLSILREYQGKGYGTEAIKHAVKYAFISCNVRRMELEAFAWNEPAIRSYTKAGFVVEGRKREATWCQGRYWDECSMGLLRKDWLKSEGLDVQLD